MCGPRSIERRRDPAHLVRSQGTRHVTMPPCVWAPSHCSPCRCCRRVWPRLRPWRGVCAVPASQRAGPRCSCASAWRRNCRDSLAIAWAQRGSPRRKGSPIADGRCRLELPHAGPWPGRLRPRRGSARGARVRRGRRHLPPVLAQRAAIRPRLRRSGRRGAARGARAGVGCRWHTGASRARRRRSRRASRRTLRPAAFTRIAMRSAPPTWSRPASSRGCVPNDGYQSGWQLEPRAAGCGGPLTMFASGSTALGDSFSLSLSQTSALVGFLAGDYIPATVLPPCPNCTVIVANAYAVAG